jgi:hypothetical protein
MIHRKNAGLVVGGFVCGILLSLAYINPYRPPATLSEAILQLSGARGNFTLGLSSTELLTFCMKLFPCVLFEMVFGVRLYAHFCTATVYVFSRTPNRMKWCLKEYGIVMISALIFQMEILISALLTVYFRYGLQWDGTGVYILFIHVLIYSLWTTSMAIAVNLLSIVAGSGMALGIVLGIQAVWIVLLSLLRLAANDVLFGTLLAANPMAHLVVGWQSVVLQANPDLLMQVRRALFLPFSIAYMLGIAFACCAAGIRVVLKRDLLVSNSEFGGE